MCSKSVGKYQDDNLDKNNIHITAESGPVITTLYYWTGCVLENAIFALPRVRWLWSPSSMDLYVVATYKG